MAYHPNVNSERMDQHVMTKTYKTEQMMKSTRHPQKTPLAPPDQDVTKSQPDSPKSLVRGIAYSPPSPGLSGPLWS